MRSATCTKLADPTVKTLVADEWLKAARSAGLEGDDVELGDIIFHAIVAVMHSPEWLAAQGVDSDDFPPIPLPADPDLLRTAAALGGRIAALTDPLVDVPGVTSGRIHARYAELGVPDDANDPVLEYGRVGRSGGQRDANGRVRWSGTGGWSEVSDEIWAYTVCGHAVLPKWLSYRVGRPLSHDDRNAFMLLCRRVAALRDLAPECDDVYHLASVHPLDAT